MINVTASIGYCVGLVVMVIVGALAAYFLFLSPYPVAQNRTIGSSVSVSGSKISTHSRSLGSYVGQCHVHDYNLTIKSHGTDESVPWLGVCNASLTDSRISTGDETLCFAVNSDNSLQATLVKVWYTYGDSQTGVSNMSYPSTPVGAGTMRVGSIVFKLVHSGDHLLFQIWSDGGTNYLCAPVATWAGWDQFGAQVREDIYYLVQIPEQSVQTSANI